MDIITKGLVNDLLYDNNGNPTEYYDEILTGIKPYINNEIQLGGGISISTELDIDDLFDENGILKEQYGGKTIVNYIKKYAKIRGFDRYFSRYTKFMNLLPPLNDQVSLLHKLVTDNTQSIQELLAEYYAYIKILTHLEYIHKKKTTNPDGTKITDFTAEESIIINQYRENIKEFENLITEIIIKLNYAYKAFNKNFENKKFKLTKLKIIDMNMFDQMFGKYIKYNLMKKNLHSIYTNNYASIEGELRSLNKAKQVKYNNLLSKLKKYKDYRLKVNNNFNKLAVKFSEIQSIKLQVLDRIAKKKEKGKIEYTIDPKIKQTIYEELTNIYTKLDNLIQSTDKMKSNFSALIDILGELHSTFINKFDTELNENNKFAVKLYEFIRKVFICKELAGLLFDQFVEFKLAYAKKDFPPPSLAGDFIVAQTNYDGIKTFFADIKKVFSVFVKKNGKGEINNATIINFIKNIQSLGIATGGSIQYGGDGGEITNEHYYFHTYDMYALFNNIDVFGGSKDLRFKLTLLRKMNHENSIYNEIKYNITDIEQQLYHNKSNNGKLIPGIVMVSKEIEYIHTNNIIAKFVNNLKEHINKTRPLFMTLLYKGVIYINLINILNSGDINIIPYKTIQINKIKLLGERFIIEVLKEKYYCFLPKHIIDLHKINIVKYNPKSDDLSKKDVEEKQKKVIFIPTFIKFNTLDYKNELKTTVKGNHIVNALYKYDIYLPIDTVFNKILIPYVDIEITDYLVNVKDENNSFTDLFKKTFSNIPVINLMSIDPSRLDLLKKIKYVLFFTNEKMKIYDNSKDPNKPEEIDITDDIKTSINNIYEDYYNFFQGYHNKIKTITNIKNIPNTKLYIPEIKEVNFMNGEIDSYSLKIYYNDNYEKAIEFFKYMYYSIINEIDINILKHDNISGIEEIKIISGPSTKIEKFIFEKLVVVKDRLISKLIVFEDIYTEIEDNKIIIYMQNILESFDKLRKVNEKEINFIIKNKKIEMPDIVGASEFYKQQLDNPDDIQIKATQKSLDFSKKLVKEGVIRPGGQTVVEDIIVVIYPSFEKLIGASVGEEIKLQEAINKSKRDSEKKDIKTLKSGYGKPLRDLFDTLITGDGAEKLIREIKVFNDNDIERKNPSGYYKNKIPITGLNKVFRSQDFVGIGKPLYKLHYYIESIIASMTDTEAKEKKDIYMSKNGAYSKYKEEYTAYVEDLKKKTEEAEETAKKQQLSKK
jgi:hypothetical protein